METTHYLAIDLGAASGRVMLGSLAMGRVNLEELHRFANPVVRLAGSWRWNLLGLWEEIKAGVTKAAQRGVKIESISVDSWALDFVLMRGREPMLRAPFQYRDARTAGPYERSRKEAGDERIFRCTGVQFMPINSLYHLLADLEGDAELLKCADRFLMIADWFHAQMTGRMVQEESNASTTQLWDPIHRQWSEELVRFFGLPMHIFPEVVPPGTKLGQVRPEFAREVGLDEGVWVVAGCTHDTGAAVAAVPAEADAIDWAYLSSGTWSLVGVELPEPLINEAVRKANFTNETGFDGTTRFLQNASGLWIVQECRRAWAREGKEYSYAELSAAAESAVPMRAFINPNDEIFLRAADMPGAIRSYCVQTGQVAPETPGEHVRCAFESLALLYRQVLDQAQQLTGRTIRVLHVVGGGSQDRVLNQLTADATGRRVLAGPVEATAVGNALLQAVTLGHLHGLSELRDVVRASFELTEFDPEESADWKEAYGRFCRLS